ncbi:MAG: flagellar motor switch protein FliN, partial [Roseburia sp.]|nr:flagellar motor switch protein FliN [Roseburia sp.]
IDGMEVGELHLSAISEAMNQMMGSAATSLSSMFNRVIDISPPMADLVDSEIMQLYPVSFAREMCTSATQAMTTVPEPTPAPQPVAPATPATPQEMPQMAPAMDMNQAMMGQPMMQMPMMGQPMMQMPMMGQPMMQMPMMGQPINVQPAQFQSFQGMEQPVYGQENIGLIMDVPLEVTVELGRTSKSIQEILDFAPGTILELNRIAGEPIDILVNGKYVAKGEVVVIEESFGVRITEIIK